MSLAGAGFAKTFQTPTLMANDRVERQKMEKEENKQRVENYQTLIKSTMETLKLMRENGVPEESESFRNAVKLAKDTINVSKKYEEQGVIPTGSSLQVAGAFEAALTTPTPEQKAETEIATVEGKKKAELGVEKELGVGAFKPEKTQEQVLSEYEAKKKIDAKYRPPSATGNVLKPVFDTVDKKEVFRSPDQIASGGDRYVPVQNKAEGSTSEFERQQPRYIELATKQKRGEALTDEEGFELESLRARYVGRPRGMAYKMVELDGGLLAWQDLDNGVLIPAKDPISGGLATSATQARSDRSASLNMSEHERKVVGAADKIYMDFADEHRAFIMQMDNVNDMIANGSEYDQPVIDKAIAWAFIRMIKPTGEVTSEAHFDSLSKLANLPTSVWNSLKNTFFTGQQLPDNTRTSMVNLLETRYQQAKKAESSVVSKAKNMTGTVKDYDWQPPYDYNLTILEKNSPAEIKTYVLEELSDQELLDIDESKLTKEQRPEYVRRMDNLR